jgi:hypothetical protein
VGGPLFSNTPVCVCSATLPGVRDSCVFVSHAHVCTNLSPTSPPRCCTCAQCALTCTVCDFDLNSLLHPHPPTHPHRTRQTGNTLESSSLLSEAVYSAINLVGMYNDHLISTAAAAAEGGDPGVVGHKSDTEALVHRLQWALTTLSSVDVVLEMLAVTTRGRSGRWKMVRWARQGSAACGWGTARWGWACLVGESRWL